MKIEAWENQEKRKAEMEMKKVEVINEVHYIIVTTVGVGVILK